MNLLLIIDLFLLSHKDLAITHFYLDQMFNENWNFPNPILTIFNLLEAFKGRFVPAESTTYKVIIHSYPERMSLAVKGVLQTG